MSGRKGRRGNTYVLRSTGLSHFSFFFFFCVRERERERERGGEGERERERERERARERAREKESERWPSAERKTSCVGKFPFSDHRWHLCTILAMVSVI